MYLIDDYLHWEESINLSVIHRLKINVKIIIKDHC